jgi:spore photoproduct lyase
MRFRRLASIAGPPIGWDSCGSGHSGPMTSPDTVDVDQPLAVDVPAAPHDASDERVPTPAALDHPHGQRIVDRMRTLGIEVERLRANCPTTAAPPGYRTGSPPCAGSRATGTPSG